MVPNMRTQKTLCVHTHNTELKLKPQYRIRSRKLRVLKAQEKNGKVWTDLEFFILQHCTLQSTTNN